MSKPTFATSHKGFTLIEVMVALAIIAISLASLIKASGSHTYSASYLKNKTLAHYVALNEIARIQVEKKWPNIGSSSKSSEMAGVEWFWVRDVEKTQSKNIRGVKFTIYLDEKRERNLAHIQAFIANPALTSADVNNQGNQSGNQQGGSSNSQGSTGTTGTTN